MDILLTFLPVAVVFGHYLVSGSSARPEVCRDCQP